MFRMLSEKQLRLTARHLSTTIKVESPAGNFSFYSDGVVSSGTEGGFLAEGGAPHEPSMATILAGATAVVLNSGEQVSVSCLPSDFAALAPHSAEIAKVVRDHFVDGSQTAQLSLAFVAPGYLTARGSTGAEVNGQEMATTAAVQPKVGRDLVHAARAVTKDFDLIAVCASL